MGLIQFFMFVFILKYETFSHVPIKQSLFILTLTHNKRYVFKYIYLTD